MKNRFIVYISCLILVAFVQVSLAQEHEVPLNENAKLQNYHRAQSDLRARIDLTLPFFEDFTDTAYYPNVLHWEDSMVYINNTLGKNNRSKGVSTFDAMNAQGLPYASNVSESVKADSLTSHYFDLSNYNPSDSLYLSFVYQGKGNGYAPQTGDSLMLYFQNSMGSWIKVWGQEGLAMNDFKTAIVAVKDTGFLHSDFRFRWVNKATYFVGNSHWHIDYIKFDQNRTYQDSVYQDVCMSSWGDNENFRSLLKEYMSMPFKHYNADPSKYYDGRLAVTMHNNWPSSTNVPVILNVKNSQTGATINTTAQSAIFGANSRQALTFTVPQSIVTTNSDAVLNLDCSAYFNSTIGGDYSKLNDTLHKQQVFDNYFAYDDGSAESAMFITSYQGAPSYVAQEYYLEVADTLRGVQIYFPQQLPSSQDKMFYLQVYKAIDANGGTNQLVYQQTDLYPQYTDRSNGFVTYAFTNPQIMDAGTYYVALMFPAGGFSDSLYIGLDKDKLGANYRYFNVSGFWEPSLIDGALMIRPLVGKALPMSINNQVAKELAVNVYPNPVSEKLFVEIENNETYNYTLIDAVGRVVKQGVLKSNAIDCNNLTEGIYFLNLKNDNGAFITKRFYKSVK